MINSLAIYARFDQNWRDFVQFFLSSFISSLTKTEAKITTITSRTMPPRGFTTSQLMIGVMTYAVINKAAKNKMVKSNMIVSTSLIFSTFTVSICNNCS